MTRITITDHHKALADNTDATIDLYQRLDSAYKAIHHLETTFNKLEQGGRL